MDVYVGTGAVSLRYHISFFIFPVMANKGSTSPVLVSNAAWSGEPMTLPGAKVLCIRGVYASVPQACGGACSGGAVLPSEC